MTRPDSKDTILRYFELYDDGTPESFGSFRFMDLLHEDLVYHFLPSPRFPVGATMRGKAAIRGLNEQLAPEWRDRRHVIHDIVADGDRVAVWATWSAFCVRDFGDIAARTRVREDFMAFFRVHDGLIAEVVQSDGPALAEPEPAQ